MRSIRENPVAARLPDFCNMGVWLRILLAVNAGLLAAALFQNHELARLPREFMELAALVEPVALATVLFLCALQRWLERLNRRQVLALCVLVPVLITLLFRLLLAPLFDADTGYWRPAFWAGTTAVLVLAWLDLLWRAHSPAVTEARLMALTARIRPHFLFNSLNAVLGVMRSDPRRAESALEELSGLFRALMQDNRELVPLSDEIALARQYLELEKLRLGERLHVRWDMQTCPPDALVPPLMLQPLLENAVYHGVEPLPDSGEISIVLSCREDRIRVELSNPYSREHDRHSGNQMALANIRERLMLFFDLEAQLDTKERDGQYVVSISFPYRKEENS